MQYKRFRFYQINVMTRELPPLSHSSPSRAPAPSSHLVLERPTVPASLSLENKVHTQCMHDSTMVDY
jgi:hypothetical protein